MDARGEGTKMKSIMIALCHLLFWLHTAQAAEVEPIEAGDITFLMLKGEIKKGDLAATKQAIRRYGYPSAIVLNSPGGDAVEAMQLGRFFREHLLSVNTFNECASACFIAWAGGYERETGSDLGIHRPYFEKQYFSELPLGEAKKKYAMMERTVREYLTEMDIPEALTNRMMSIESNDVQYLDSVSLLASHIGEYATKEREWLVSKCGGLDQSERTSVDIYRQVLMYEYTERQGLEAVGQIQSPETYEYVSTKVLGSKTREELEVLDEKARKIARCTRTEIAKVRNGLSL